MEPPCAAIAGSMRSFDAVEAFEFVQEPSQRYRLQAETLGQSGLGQTLVFGKVYDDRRARMGHSGYPGTKRPVIDLAPKPGGVVQSFHDRVVVVFAARFRPYTTWLPSRPGGGRLLQQLPGRRFLNPVAMHDSNPTSADREAQSWGTRREGPEAMVLRVGVLRYKLEFVGH
jgi:hypothetical protein